MTDSFAKDSATSPMDGVNAVYIKVNGKDILEIFPTQYTSSDSCRFTSSPSEKGTETIDSKVRMPVVVRFTGTVMKEGFSALNTIRASIKSNIKKDAICEFFPKELSQSEGMKTMLVERLDVSGTQDKLDALTVSVSLKELIQVGAK